MTPKKTLADALHFLAVNRKLGKDMQYLHVRLSPDLPESAMDAIAEIAKTKFGKDDHQVFRFAPHNELLITTHTRLRPMLTDTDRAITEAYPGGASRIMANDLGEDGLGLLIRVLGKLIGENDRLLQMAHKRLARTSNVIIVLDDDPIILRTCEKILKMFGDVHVVDTPEKFFEIYEDVAPNIAFIDIHLRGYKGPPIVKVAREKFDPHIHAVLISSDTAKETVMSIKDSGAAGFIVKPFSRDTLFQHLLNAPTFVSKGI